MEGNWYDNAPEACDLTNLKAPVYYYIRTLRIAYEVIKTVDPEAYVAVGGIGYPSFLDAVLRYTDKPEDGAVNNDFPHAGGAYFDALSYHAYPANDGSLRYYDEDLQEWIHTRHSDAAADGVIRLKNDFNTVLEAHDYGTTYPQKRWIITESNISRKEFNDQMGSEIGQRNFMTKVMVNVLKNGIDQFYTYTLGDVKTNASAGNSWDLMGFYYSLREITTYNQQITPNGITFKTAADLLHAYSYSIELTNQLDLPENIAGAGFVNDNDDAMFVLWAKTLEDRSEEASAMYSFPSNMNVEMLEKREWDYSQNGNTQMIPSSDINLTGTPIFLLGEVTLNTQPVATEINSAIIHPNPASKSLTTLTLKLHAATEITAAIYHTSGQKIRNVCLQKQFTVGEHQMNIPIEDLASGSYFYQLNTHTGMKVIPFVVL